MTAQDRTAAFARGFREIGGPTRDTRTWEAKALECLHALDVLPADDLAREDYRCAAQVYALFSVADALGGEGIKPGWSR